MFEQIREAQLIARKFIEKCKGDKSFTWLGTAYPCSVGNSINPEGEEIVFGGLMQASEMVIAVRLALFENGIGPVKGEEITFNDKPYIVDRDIVSDFGVFKQLYCTAANNLTMT